MIVGNPTVFAIESKISQAYERLSLRGIGYFTIHVRGQNYGLRSPESTMLACSFDAVGRRIADRGRHSAPFSSELDAGKIADAVRHALYAEERDGEVFLGMPQQQFSELIYSKQLIWAPDGDEAFDDRSYVLHFDVGDSVRLIAFKCGNRFAHDPATLRDLWVSADEFYRVLQDWRESFEIEWRSLPKVHDGEFGNCPEGD